MSYTIIRPATHEEWLEERAKGIGSSEVGTIMGVNHFDTAYKLWRRKVGIDGPIESNEAMEMGHLLEPAVAQRFEEITGHWVVKNSAGDWIAVDDERPWLRVSPDRVYIPKGEKRTRANWCILECKTTSQVIDPENIPLYWRCQVQYQMGVLGIQHACIAWISTSPKLHFDYTDMEFNPGFYESMTKELDYFWNENILKGIAPSDQNAEDTLLRYPKGTEGKTVTADEEVIAAWEHLHTVKSQLTDLETEKDILEGLIKQSMGDAEILLGRDGATISSWKNAKETLKFDSKAFQKAEPEIYRKYQVMVPGNRRFIIR